MARPDIGPLVIEANAAEDLHFTRAGRRQPQVRLAAGLALPADQGAEPSSLVCAGSEALAGPRAGREADADR